MTSTDRLPLLTLLNAAWCFVGINSTVFCNSPQYLELGKTGTIQCVFQEGFFGVYWYNTTDYRHSDPILHYDNAEIIGAGYESGEFNVHPNGSLILREVSLKHERVFTVAYIHTKQEGAQIIQVQLIAFVIPTPNYPVIDGCSDEHFCVLKVRPEGNLSCKVTGIRPKIQLRYSTFHRGDTDLISFTNQQLIVKNNGETYDVSLIATYHVREKTLDILSIECKGHELETVLHLTTIVDLSFIGTDDDTPMEGEVVPVTINNLVLILPVTAVAAIIFVCGTVLLIYCLNRNVQDSEKTSDSNETMNMLPAKSNEPKDLLGVFLKQIKTKYKDWYDAVQPIPYIKDRLYCVDKVFVEGGIEFQDSVEGIEGRGIWKTLGSYEDVFIASQVSSPRRILEGEPGYGKSTVTLQFAYDWCNPKPTSFLKDVEIFILLRLRQLGGVPSIYKAIKRFILPTDSTISETDIENLLRNSKSVVIILDGFDEYPDKDSTTVTDIMRIIARQMFQDSEVVTTTRSSFLPKKYPPLTKRIRLTGFDDKARRYYIRKAVVGDNDEGVRKIERYLEENPILSDLCQVPLLFVIFAHMTYESVQFRNLNSVTSFFRYMISCFHSHMRNKMNDENVRKYELFETDHQDLDRLAFAAFSGQSQKLIWDKDEMRQSVGHEFYEQYVRIGILVEEESVYIQDDPNTPVTELVQYKTEVRFYHKLFCEWYAAYYLTDYLQQNPAVHLSDFLRNLDPCDVQYLYRFACGINSKSAEKLIDYLKNIEGGDKFAILCILEKTGKVDNIKETIRQLCAEGIIISNFDTLLLQRSYMQLLEIAARNDIPIKYVTISNCLQSVDLSTATIRTTSGLALSSGIPFEELMVSSFNRDMTEAEAVDVLHFASKCSSLRYLGYFGCVPPQVFTDGSTLSSLKSVGVEVQWYLGSGEPAYILNLQTGRWEGVDGEFNPTEEDFERMLQKIADDRQGWSEVTYKRWLKEGREGLRELAEKERAKAKSPESNNRETSLASKIFFCVHPLDKKPVSTPSDTSEKTHRK